MMKKIARFRFLNEEEDIVLAHHPNSSARRITTLTSIQQNPTILDGHDGEIPDLVYNPTPLRWYRPPEADNFNEDDQNQTDDGVETHESNPRVLDVDEVDTMLKVSYYVSRNSKIPSVMKSTNNLRPHRFFRINVEDDGVDTTLSLRPPGTTTTTKSAPLIRNPNSCDKSRKQSMAGQRKKRSKRSNNGDDDNQHPLLPIEQIQGLCKVIKSLNGSRPIFLYRKVLEESDVKKEQNRLFVVRRERMMQELLTEKEGRVVDGGGKGLMIMGVDGQGKVFENLGLKKWSSLEMTVINSDWRKVVAANNAKKGDVVEIWGFRLKDEQPCLAFNFTRVYDAASSSGTSCSGEGTSQSLEENTN